MKLNEYPTPEDNAKFGFHLFPFPQDLDGRDKQTHLWPLEQTKSMGGQWVCMISSPGGVMNWPGNRPGSAEWSFELANELDLFIMLRIYCSSQPPYWSEAIHKNLEQLVSIASGRPFYVKFNNEIDAEWHGDTGHHMTLKEAKKCCVAIGEAIGRTWEHFNGLVIPSFLNVGYGGSGYNFFELMHEVGMGDSLDRCWVPVHPYAGGWEPMWPWSERLLQPILYTEETYAEHSRWEWKLDAPDKRTLEEVNKQLLIAHEQRMALTTTEDLMAAYAYGFFTYKWSLYQLDQLGHTETPLLFPEWGTRVGEDMVVGPKIDAAAHAARTIEMIKLMQQEPRILGGANWILDTRGGVQTNWKDQGIYCEIWDKRVVSLAEHLAGQIVTPGRLPLADILLSKPVTRNYGGGGEEEPEEPEEPEEAEEEEEEEVTEPELVNNAESYGVFVTPATPEPGQKYFKIVEVHHYGVGENGGYPGNRNLFMDVLDEDGNRLNGVKIVVKNTGNGAINIAVVDKPASEPGTNVPINPGDTLAVWIDFPSTGYASDIVNNVHSRHPDEGEDVRVAHHSFLVVWQLVTKAGDEEPEEPEPEEITEDDIVRAAWVAMYPTGGILYNPDSALLRVARSWNFGAPVTKEFDLGKYRVQGFANRILYTVIGEWDDMDIMQLRW